MKEAVDHGLDMAIVNYAKMYPLYKIPEAEAELARKLIYFDRPAAIRCRRISRILPGWTTYRCPPYSWLLHGAGKIHLGDRGPSSPGKVFRCLRRVYTATGALQFACPAHPLTF
jgi:hypothetical protein